MFLIDWTMFLESNLLVQTTCFKFTPTIYTAAPAYPRANYNGPGAEVPAIPVAAPIAAILAEMLLPGRMMEDAPALA